MPEMITVDDVKSSAYRALEGFLFLPLALLVLVGFALAAAPGFVGASGDDVSADVLGSALLLFVVILLVSAVAIPALLYVDARRVRAADVEWNPRPILYAIGGFLFSYLALLHYIWKRHEHVVDRQDSTRWWKVLGLGAAGPLVPLAVYNVLTQSTSDPFLLAVPLGVGAVLTGLFPIAAYKDATYVRLRSGEWQPNPGNYVTIGIFMWALAPIVYPLTAAYYLFKRHRALGVP